MTKIAMNVAECAELLGVSEDVIYREVSAKRLPHQRVGRRIILHRPTIEKWLAGEVGA